MNEIERIRELGSDLPEVRDEVHAASRAALMERFEPPRPRPSRVRRLRRRGFALAGAIAATAALFLVLFSSGEAPTGKPEQASAADLQRLAKISPNLLIHGPTWNLIGIEANSAVEGRTAFFHGDPPADPDHFPPGHFAELRWRSMPAKERRSQLVAEGFTKVGEEVEDNPFEHVDRAVPFYAPRDRGSGAFPVVGIWQEHNRAFEFRQNVRELLTFEEALERLYPVDTTEWISKERPGLTIVGPVTSKPSETPPGRNRHGYIVGPPPKHKPDTPAQERHYFERAFSNGAIGGPSPIVRREGDRTWMVVRKFADLSQLWLPPPDA